MMAQVDHGVLFPATPSPYRVIVDGVDLDAGVEGDLATGSAVAVRIRARWSDLSKYDRLLCR
ncbi:hypothetical protein GCM10010193_33210 [Kitasatospora atroaurantiaca]|uniref:Uncharacterized protein n=3 Tax=Kitasatospora atroaurantiaca TaxID=285545 RepID=A0A561ERQ4_9ACTN|nr:hypothetical protein FB465_3358 [Kitasatospora atroaurantiaca]